MIPILFKKDVTGTELSNKGGLNLVGRLDECSACVCSETLNGNYEINFEYPVNGRFVDEIAPYAVILANNNGTVDAFRISQISTPNVGFVSVKALHISFDLSGVVMKNITRTNESSFLTAMGDSAQIQGSYSLPWNFHIDSDQYDAGEYLHYSEDFSSTNYRTVNDLMRGTGGLLDTYGGEWYFNLCDATLYAHRGEDRGYRISYGVNLISGTQGIDASNVAAEVFPFAFFNDSIFWLPASSVSMPDVTDSKIVLASAAYGYGQVLPMDVTSAISQKYTQEEISDMNTAAKKQTAIYAVAKQAISEAVEKGDISTTPDVSIDVDFVMLGDTTEFSLIKDAEDLRLGDIITVSYPAIGDMKAKVYSMEYDVLAERILSVQIGTVSKNYVANVNSQIKSVTAQIERIEQAAARLGNVKYFGTVENCPNYSAGMSTYQLLTAMPSNCVYVVWHQSAQAFSDAPTVNGTYVFFTTGLANSNFGVCFGYGGGLWKYNCTDTAAGVWTQIYAGTDGEKITPTTNLNTLGTGNYLVNGVQNSGFPESVLMYGVLVQTEGTYKCQVFYGGKSGDANIYIRRWQTGSASYTAWKTLG